MTFIPMQLIVASLLLQDVAEADVLHQEIPSEFRGTWATNDAECKKEYSTERVYVGARTVDFYEAHAFLRLARLNHASDPPIVHGYFDFDEEARFRTASMNLQIVGPLLFITEGDSDAERNINGLVKCAEVK